MSADRFSAPSIQFPALPSLVRIAAGADRILARWPDVVADPPERDRERLIREMLDRVENDRWDGAWMSVVTKAARALYHPDWREHARFSALRDFYVREIRASQRKTFLGAMFSVYLGSYVPGAAHTRALALALDAAKQRLGARERQLVDPLPELLDPLRAPLAVATLMESMTDPWNDLKKIGLRAPHGPGLMEHSHLEYVRRLQPTLKSRAGLERLFAWVKPGGAKEPLRTGGAQVISAGLGHWRSATPRADDLSYIVEMLVGLYGDPRVSSGGAWATVSPDILAIMHRWLTGENIRFFLDVVSAVEDSHMWEPRRRFWLKLHQQGRIDAAWVAFSPSAASHARRVLASRDGARGLQYGTQVAGGSDASKSLLIMQIGRRIVVEGSHNFKIHIFHESTAGCPKLYISRYDIEDIKGHANAKIKVHLGDWQSWVVENI
jgi:hypothetical protein